MQHVTMYTSASPTRYVCLLSHNSWYKELVCDANYTTCNRLELRAVIAGLLALKRRCDVTVVTNNWYAVNMLRNANPRVNRQLVRHVRQLAKRHVLTVKYCCNHKLSHRLDALSRSTKN